MRFRIPVNRQEEAGSKTGSVGCPAIYMYDWQISAMKFTQQLAAVSTGWLIGIVAASQSVKIRLELGLSYLATYVN